MLLKLILVSIEKIVFSSHYFLILDFNVSNIGIIAGSNNLDGMIVEELIGLKMLGKLNQLITPLPFFLFCMSLIFLNVTILNYFNRKIRSKP